MSVAATA